MPAWRLGPPEDWPTLGWVAIDWIETYLCHGPGGVQGQPIVLDDEWCQVLLDVYRLHPRGHRRAGRRAVRRALLSRAKGRAKSELAGMIVCFDTVGPSRFDGWNAKGEPVGRPIMAPLAKCFATEEDQSGNTYDNVRVMLEHVADHHDDEFSLDPGLTRCLIRHSGGEIVACSAAGASKDGGKESLDIFDETHLYVPQRLRDMHQVGLNNLGKRKDAEGWALETTTMFELGERSVAETTFAHLEKVRAGKIVDRSDLYANHREGFDVKDWDDDDEVVASMVEAFGDAAEWQDWDQKLAKIRDPESTEANSRRYWLNQARPGDKAALDLKQWKLLERDRPLPAAGAYVALGFDGSISDDSTVLWGCTPDGWLFEVAVWERPADAPPGWRVPRLDVHRTVTAARDLWRVGRFFCDPPKWDSEIEQWTEEFGMTRDVDGKETPVVIMLDTNQWSKWSVACRRFTTAVAEGVLTHDGSAVLERHLGATKRKAIRARADEQDDGRTRFVFVKIDHRKIDAVIAATMAYEAAMTMPPEPPPRVAAQVVLLEDFLNVEED